MNKGQKAACYRWVERNPEKARLYSRIGMWKRQGIKKRDGSKFLEEDYQELVKLQANLCAICRRSSEKMTKRLGVDHDHKTGFVRGLLCDSCNCKVGVIEDLIFANLAKQYLKERL